MALENGVVPSFVLFKWLNCIASVKCRLQTIELLKVTIFSNIN